MLKIYHADCLDLLEQMPKHSVQAIVTDPPFGIEFSKKQTKNLRNKKGIWRVPPKDRNPLPRFSTLTKKQKKQIFNFFKRWAPLAYKVLCPGGNLIIASHPMLSHIVYLAITQAGFERRGSIIRLTRTLRGGDRVKEYPYVCTLPRSSWEPWGMFRKPFPSRKNTKYCLINYRTGGFRTLGDKPFVDVIKCAPTHKEEKKHSPHPCLKPQRFMRQLVRAVLPLGEGIVLDPFMGGGSTVAACKNLGYDCIGIERNKRFFNIAKKGIPCLAGRST